MKTNQKGIAFLTVLILVLVLTIIANTLLLLLSSQTRLIESNIQRTRAVYANEAAMIERVERLRKGLPPLASTSIDGITVTMSQSSNSGIANTDTMNFTQDYTTSLP